MGTTRSFLKVVRQLTIMSGAFCIGQPGIGHISHVTHRNSCQLLAMSAANGYVVVGLV